MMDFARSSKEVFDENLRIAWAEMTGKGKESVLERKFEQAESYRPGKKDGEGDGEGDGGAAGEGAARSGPSDLVVVPQAQVCVEALYAGWFRLD